MMICKDEKNGKHGRRGNLAREYSPMSVVTTTKQSESKGRHWRMRAPLWTDWNIYKTASSGMISLRHFIAEFLFAHDCSAS